MADSNFRVSPRVLAIRYLILVKPSFNQNSVKNIFTVGSDIRRVTHLNCTNST